MPLRSPHCLFSLLAVVLLVPAPAVAAPTDLALPIATHDSPNQDDRPPKTVIDTIIIHDTKSPGVNDAEGIARWFARPDAECSAHYVIGKGGEIIQCVPESKRAWHAGPSHFLGRKHVNDFAIGIEVVNDETGRDPFTDAQYRSLIALTADIVERYHISLDHIVGHRDVTDFPKLRQDPADNFDWDRFRRGLQQTLASAHIHRVSVTEASYTHKLPLTGH